MNKQILSFLFFCFFLSVGISRAQEVVVVSNKNVKASDVTSDELKEVFSGEKTSLKDGSHVVPVTLKGGAAHDAFLRRFVGKNDAAFRAAWRSLVFTGQAAMPKTFDTEAQLLDYVAATPGAIGYVGKDPGDNVKRLAVK